MQRITVREIQSMKDAIDCLRNTELPLSGMRKLSHLRKITVRYVHQKLAQVRVVFFLWTMTMQQAKRVRCFAQNAISSWVSLKLCPIGVNAPLPIFANTGAFNV